MRISILLISAVLVVAFVSCKEQLSLNNEKIEEYMGKQNYFMSFCTLSSTNSNLIMG